MPTVASYLGRFLRVDGAFQNLYLDPEGGIEFFQKFIFYIQANFPENQLDEKSWQISNRKNNNRKRNRISDVKEIKVSQSKNNEVTLSQISNTGKNAIFLANTGFAPLFQSFLRSFFFSS